MHTEYQFVPGKAVIRAFVLAALIFLVPPHILAAGNFPARVMETVDDDTLRVSRGKEVRR